MEIKTSATIQKNLRKELELCPGRWQNLMNKEWVAVDDLIGWLKENIKQRCDREVDYGEEVFDDIVKELSSLTSSTAHIDTNNQKTTNSKLKSTAQNDKVTYQGAYIDEEEEQ